MAEAGGMLVFDKDSARQMAAFLETPESVASESHGRRDPTRLLPRRDSCRWAR